MEIIIKKGQIQNRAGKITMFKKYSKKVMKKLCNKLYKMRISKKNPKLSIRRLKHKLRDWLIERFFH